MSAERGVTAIILAGGRGTRMGGVNKALLRVDGETFLARQLCALREIADEILIVGGEREVVGARAIADRRRDCGPLGGMEAGLIAAANACVLVVACDYPAVTREVLGLLVDACGNGNGNGNGFVPKVNGRVQPLLACYDRSVVGQVTAALDRGDLRVRDWLERIDVVYLEEDFFVGVDPALRAFLNVNVPGDLEKVGQ